MRRFPIFWFDRVSTMRMGREYGFSLIELVVVIVLTAILVATFFPRASTKSSLTIAGQAYQLASDIRYVQSLSMTRGQRYCVNLTSTGYSMTTSNCSTSVGVEHPAGIAFPVTLDGV